MNGNNYIIFNFYDLSGPRRGLKFNKMSSLLNVSNDASRKSEEISVKDIELFVDSDEQKWFKRAHVGKFLGIEDIWTSLNGLEKCEILTRLVRS